MISENPYYLESDNVSFKKDDFDINIYEIFKFLNLSVKRFYFLKSRSKKSLRGGHAHMNQAQVFINIHGFANLKATNSNGHVFKFELNESEKPLYVPSNFWIELELMPHSKVLCLASESYSKLKSINDKTLFLKKDGL